MKPMELKEVLRRNLIGRRKELKLTQVQVAEMAGLSQPSISSFESGDAVPEVPTLAKLAAALRVEPDMLLRPGTFYPMAA